MNAVELLREQFNSHVAVREKRPGVLQLIAPLFHEDGDMMDIVLDLPRNDTSAPPKLRVSDHGLSLMRLSYAFDKQFTSLNEFKENSVLYLEREIAR